MSLSASRRGSFLQVECGWRVRGEFVPPVVESCSEGSQEEGQVADYMSCTPPPMRQMMTWVQSLQGIVFISNPYFKVQASSKYCVYPFFMCSFSCRYLGLSRNILRVDLEIYVVNMMHWWVLESIFWINHSHYSSKQDHVGLGPQERDYSAWVVWKKGKGGRHCFQHFFRHV